MPLEAGLLAYAAFAGLALTQKKHRPVPPLPAMPSPRLARALGIALLMVSAVLALTEANAARGAVLWIGEISLAAILLVLLLSWRPRFAVMMSAPALVAGLLIVLL